MNLYHVTCDNGETYDDHSHYSTVVRANSVEEARKDGLSERECSKNWTADVELIVVGIDRLEALRDLFPEIVKTIGDMVFEKVEGPFFYEDEHGPDSPVNIARGILKKLNEIGDFNV